MNSVDGKLVFDLQSCCRWTDPKHGNVLLLLDLEKLFSRAFAAP